MQVSKAFLGSSVRNNYSFLCDPAVLYVLFCPNHSLICIMLLENTSTFWSTQHYLLILISTVSFRNSLHLFHAILKRQLIIIQGFSQHRI